MDGAALERRYIEEAFHYFNGHAEWPTIERLHLLMVKSGLDDVSVGDVLTFFSRHSGAFHSFGIASLPLADFLNLPEAELLAREFVQVVQLLVEKFRATPAEEKPILTSAEVQEKLSIDEKEIRKLYQLLQQREGGVLTNGFTLHPDDGHWDCIVSPNVMLFKNVMDLRQYLLRRDEKFPSRQAMAPTEPTQPEPGRLEGRAVAFLLMPFDASMDRLRDEVIAAGADVNVKVVRADDIFSAGIIIEQIKQHIKKADAVIAVCTGRNANVFYELGIAEASQTPILVAEQKSDIPFDVQHFRVQFYGGNEPGNRRDTLRKRIASALAETIPEERRGVPLAKQSQRSRGRQHRGPIPQAVENRSQPSEHKTAVDNALIDLASALTEYARHGEDRGFYQDLVPTMLRAIATLRVRCPQLAGHLNEIGKVIGEKSHYFDVSWAQTTLIDPLLMEAQKCV
jgi:hypothetical protein